MPNPADRCSVLVLGAGRVSGPLVRYLLEQAGGRVTVADMFYDNAARVVAGHPDGTAREVRADDERGLADLVSGHALVVSLLPYVYHVRVARLCLEYRRHLVTTSYVSPEMWALDQAAEEAGVLLLNEVGLDPGIDHMSALAVIERVRESGGRVTGFESFCGGLPAPGADDNPLRYKFSWNPKGVLLAGLNDARYRENGREVLVPGRELFEHCRRLRVEDERLPNGFLEFEGYPNRNSLPYLEVYGLSEARTMLRGTLRYPGWCETLRAVGELGLLTDEARDDLAGLTRAGWVRKQVPGTGDLRGDVAGSLGLAPDAPAVTNMAWLGMFDDEPVGIEQGSGIDILAGLMLERMAYRPCERDMVVLRHEFAVEYPDRPVSVISSTLVDFGEPGGESAMARTVGLPAAIAARLIVEGRVRLTGVRIPVLTELYRPILDELAGIGINCVEKQD